MKTIVFDSGPVISLTMNNLLWVFEELKKEGTVRFVMTELVKQELVDNPLKKTKRFMFEALQVQHYINNGTFEVITSTQVKKETERLLSIANNTYHAFDHNMNLIHAAEASAVALYLQLNADAFVVDERTTRLLIENPRKLHYILRRKFHTTIKAQNAHINQFRGITKTVKIIRSVELVTIAYEKGLLNKYVADIPDARKKLLESVIWGVKLNGCAVSKKELEQIMRIER